MTLSFEPIEMKTRGRLTGVRSLVRLLKDLDPEYVERKHAELRRFARDKGFDAAEYSMEREILDHEVRFRLPQFAAYAVVTLLHTILEVHLRECAKRAEERLNLRFSPDDLKDRGIERYATYLSKSGLYDAKCDEAWLAVTDLRAIRNLIVHEAGTDIKQEVAKRLKERYKEKFDYLEDGTGWWKEVWISADLCQQFTDKVEAFSNRCFSAVNSATLREES